MQGIHHISFSPKPQSASLQSYYHFKLIFVSTHIRFIANSFPCHLGAGEGSGDFLIGFLSLAVPPRLTSSVVGHEYNDEVVGRNWGGGGDSCLSWPAEADDVRFGRRHGAFAVSLRSAG